MVRKILHMFYREFSGLHQAAFLLGSFALLSQLLALVRDRLLAHFFGASQALDLYYAAFRIPDFLFVSIASLVSLTVLIPFLVSRLEKSQETARHFIDQVFTAFFVAIVTISLIVYAAMPFLTGLVFPGFDGSEHETVILLARILLLSPILLGVSNLFGSITQTYHRFFVYALSPVLYNVGIIIGILAFYPTWGLPGLVWGVILGAIFHVAIQIPVVAQHGFIPRPTLRIKWQEIKQVAFLSLPRTIGLSAKHFTLLALIGLASLFVEGSITVFNLSYNLQSVPLSIIGVSYSVAAFPTLTRLFSDNRVKEFTANIITASRHIIFWSLPILVLFIVLRAQIVRTILGSGAFSWADTRLTAAALALFAVSLVAQGLELLFVRGYYAAGKTKIPVFVNIATAIGIVGFAYGLLYIFQHVPIFRYFVESLLRIEGLSGTAVVMLPLAFSVGMIANAVILFILFKQRFGEAQSSLVRTFWQSFAGAVVMGFVAYHLLRVLASVLDLNTFIGIFTQGFVAGIGGIIAGLAVLRALGNVELLEFMDSLKGRFWKARTVAPEQEEL